MRTIWVNEKAQTVRVRQLKVDASRLCRRTVRKGSDFMVKKKLWWALLAISLAGPTCNVCSRVSPVSRPDDGQGRR